MANELPKELQITTEQKNTDSSAFETGTRMQMKPLGSSGTELFAGYFSEEYLQLLRGRKGAKVFDEMRRSESQVAMLLSAVMNPIKAGVWEFEAASGDVANAELHKELVEFCAKDGIDWETHLHEALTLLIHGYSLFEIVHSVVFNHPKFGTFNGLKGLAFRSQKTIERWNVDASTGNLKEVVQWVQGDLTNDRSAMLTMLAEFLLVFTLQKEGDNYEGISALRPMYGPWFRKNLYLRIAAIGIEKNAIGTPIGTIPKGKNKAEDEEGFREAISNFTAHEAAYILKPEGWTIELLESKFNAAGVKEMILLENTEMINSLVANFLALGMNGGGGAFALGSDLSDFFLSGIQNFANIICGVWNRKLIPDLVKLNYGPQAAYPKLKATGINDKAGKELAEIIKSLTESQALKPDMPLEEFLRKSFGLPKPDPTTTREVKPQASPFQFSEDDDGVQLGGPGSGPQGGGSQTSRAANGQIKIKAPKSVGEASALVDEMNGHLEHAAKEASANPKDGPAQLRLRHAVSQHSRAMGMAKKFLLSEDRVQLAETWRVQWKNDKDSLKKVMQEGLTNLLESYKKQIKSKWASATPAQRKSIALDLQPKGLTAYREALREELARIANVALIGARKETPKAKNVKLSERIQLAAPSGGYFDALPNNVKRIVRAQADLIAQTQAGDIGKIVSFQFHSSETSTDDVDQVLLDIDDSVLPSIEDGATGKGMSVDAAAGNAVSSTANQARLEWFFEPEVLDTIESFTFTNEDPVSEICQELDGTTWAVGDPDLDRYSPPLHHNCKSRLEPNEKGAEGNPEIQNGTPVSQDALDSITLCECDYHIEFKLKEEK